MHLFLISVFLISVAPGLPVRLGRAIARSFWT
jgi:hypothetical protein